VFSVYGFRLSLGPLDEGDKLKMKVGMEREMKMEMTMVNLGIKGSCEHYPI